MSRVSDRLAAALKAVPSCRPDQCVADRNSLRQGARQVLEMVAGRQADMESADALCGTLAWTYLMIAGAQASNILNKLGEADEGGLGEDFCDGTEEMERSLSRTTDTMQGKFARIGQCDPGRCKAERNALRQAARQMLEAARTTAEAMEQTDKLCGTNVWLRLSVATVTATNILNQLGETDE